MGWFLWALPSKNVTNCDISYTFFSQQVVNGWPYIGSAAMPQKKSDPRFPVFEGPHPTTSWRLNRKVESPLVMIKCWQAYWLK